MEFRELNENTLTKWRVEAAKEYRKKLEDKVFGEIRKIMEKCFGIMYLGIFLFIIFDIAKTVTGNESYGEIASKTLFIAVVFAGGRLLLHILTIIIKKMFFKKMYSDMINSELSGMELFEKLYPDDYNLYMNLLSGSILDVKDGLVIYADNEKTVKSAMKDIDVILKLECDEEYMYYDIIKNNFTVVKKYSPKMFV